MNHITLIYESFNHKKGTELNGWTSVVSIDNRQHGKLPILNFIFRLLVEPVGKTLFFPFL